MLNIFSILRYWRLKLLIALFRALARLVEPPPRSSPDAILAIPSRDPGRAIKVHVYQPGGVPNSPAPVLVNIFGGGFVLPLHGADDLYCRRVASSAGYVVLDVDYRLAPEHPFPAAIHDAEDAICYVLDHAAEYKTSHVSISGFSSGGTCALAMLGLFPKDTFRSVITFYPSTNAAEDPSTRVAPVSGGKRLPAFWTRIFREAYFGDADPRDLRISPINAAGTTPYPAHMLVITAEMDTSALEAEALAAKAMGTGRSVVVKRMKRVGHNFDKKVTNQDCARAREESYGLAIDILRTVARQ
ncbi:carboxylesterase [Cordyceps fumosorosea ARSEF 2679]|uniref:Carboxylesterase n=1 Tax=Cordyceps fumosorosea (strain ARSEF 2679) TaxID=1081104 RepID=A0A162I6C8_CORFA|nr:carboxylesterase [Cordyceps fumosorosea ARSEF 2679]OAA52885.1 carboxylesterase [Cordyceps fumosorosea ARSEF 2679]